MLETINFFDQIVDIADMFMSSLYEFSSTVLWWITTDLIDIARYYDPMNIAGFVLPPFFYNIFGGYSLLELFFGFGIGFYLIWQLVAWIIDILP